MRYIMTSNEFRIRCKDNHKHELSTKSYSKAHYCRQCAIWVPIDMWKCTCCGLRCRSKGTHTKYNLESECLERMIKQRDK